MLTVVLSTSLVISQAKVRVKLGLAVLVTVRSLAENVFVNVQVTVSLACKLIALTRLPSSQDEVVKLQPAGRGVTSATEYVPAASAPLSLDWPSLRVKPSES